METEKETMNTELIHARVEVTKIQSESEKVQSEKDGLAEQLQELKTDADKAGNSKKEVFILSTVVNCVHFQWAT